MEDQIKEMLKQGILTSQDIAFKLGKRKVKDIQNLLNKLLNQKMIKKDKIGSQNQWSLVHDEVAVEVIEESFQEQISKHENQEAKLSEINSYVNLLKLVNSNFIQDILFLRREVEKKNELIASQQQIINVLVLDQHKQRIYPTTHQEDDFKPYTKTFKPYMENLEKPFGMNSRYQPLYNVASSEQDGKDNDDNDFNDDVCYSLESDKVDVSKQDMRMNNINKHLISQQSSSSKSNEERPSVVVYDEPEKNHFKNNYKKDLHLRRENNKSLILLVGDSMVKNITGYQLKQKCKQTNVMVRSHVGGKIKNIKNLMLDLLEDVKPNAVCFHVATNDISSGRSIEEIVCDIENLVDLLQRQGVVPVISLLTPRSDKFATKVEIINKRLIILCNHENITKNHLNIGGLHIAREHTSLFSNNFVNFFNYLTQNNFCIQ